MARYPQYGNEREEEPEADHHDVEPEPGRELLADAGYLVVLRVGVDQAFMDGVAPQH